MAEPAANTVSSDYLWAELARLVALVGLEDWSRSIHQVLWADSGTTREDVEDLVEGLRLDLLRLAAANKAKCGLCEVLELAVGHLHVFEWAALTRPSLDEEPLGAVIELEPRLRQPDPVASRALESANRLIADARERAKGLVGTGRSRG